MKRGVQLYSLEEGERQIDDKDLFTPENREKITNKQQIDFSKTLFCKNSGSMHNSGFFIRYEVGNHDVK